ncbi:type II CAAX endopeptidase family protein [Balneolaceae bacterium ANBcel3]|nr:type II CAAX endopeptidase family protein [Balneolaceae bacterium ANBcel3]
MNVSYSEPQDYLPLIERSWTERNGIPHWLVGIVWLVIAFILFQAIATVVLVGLVMATEDFSLEMLMDIAFGNRIDLFLWANSSGQLVGLLLATWIVAHISTKGSVASFMRFNVHHHTLKVIGLTVLLMIAVQPLIVLFSWINQFYPFSESYLAYEEQALEMIKQMLTVDGIVFMALLHVGLVPSVCEEVLFRGYLQRLFEKSWGPAAAIIVTGLLFGFFHIRLTQLLPLALIGILLGWLVWRSNSIYPGMVAHLVNNGGTVVVSALYPAYVFDQYDSTELPEPWLLLVSIGSTAILIYMIHQLTRKE